MELILGTHEQQLLGYAFLKDGDIYKLEPLCFNNHAHKNSINTISSNDKFLVSGTNDENIVIFNMRSRTEVGSLCQHNGTITCLEFYKNINLFSGSEDGIICMWDTLNWECVKTLRGAKDAIIGLSVHHSGKLAVSISKDKTLCMWNLARGRTAFLINIKAVPELVKFCPNGTKFILAINNKLDVYSLETAMVEYMIKFNAKINCAAFLTNDLVAIGGDKDSIEVYNLTEKMKVCTISASLSKRIKALSTFDFPFKLEESKTKSVLCLASVSLDGHLTVWSVHLLNKSIKITMLAQVDTCTRASCMTAWFPGPAHLPKESQEESSKKRKGVPFVLEESNELMQDMVKVKKTKFSE